MSNLTAYKKDVLHDKMFDHVPELFPSYKFKPYGGGWASPFCLDGSQPSNPRPDKTRITASVPDRVFEQGKTEESLDIVDFYRVHVLNLPDTGEGFFETCVQLARKLGLPEPSNEGETEQHRKDREKRDALETLSLKMKKALFEEEGKKTLDYLKTVRGYGEDFIRESGFGHVGAQLAKEVSKLCDKVDLGSVGIRHTLALPYRSWGVLKGFTFRLPVGGNVSDKYRENFQDSKFKKKFNLFGLSPLRLKGNTEEHREIVIVEGEIDALRGNHALKDIKDAPLIVACAGREVSRESLQPLKEKDVHRVTILFDTEETEEKQRKERKGVEKVIRTLNGEGFRVLVCELPREHEGQKVDVDEYLKTHTGEQFLYYLRNFSQSGATWLAMNIFNDKITDDGTGVLELTDTNVEILKDKFIALHNDPLLCPPIDRKRVLDYFEHETGNSITTEELEREAERKRFLDNSKKQKEGFIDLLQEVGRIAEKGSFSDAVDLLNEKVSDLKQLSTEDKFSKFLKTPTEEEIRKHNREQVLGVETPFSFLTLQGRVEPFLLPSGGLTYFCLPTNHGKSSIMRDLALHVVQQDRSGVVLFFTYEEDEGTTRNKFLNTFIGERLHHDERTFDVIRKYQMTGDPTCFDSANLRNLFDRKEGEFIKFITSGRLRIYDEKPDTGTLCDLIKFLGDALPVKAVFIDYVQRLSVKGVKGGKTEVLTDVCDRLADMATKVNFPVVLGAQLNRQTKSPLEMSAQNISDASEVEKGATVVVLGWNSNKKALPNSDCFATGTEAKTAEASLLHGRGFHLGEEGKIYLLKVKDRNGATYAETLLDFDGDTGKTGQNVNFLNCKRPQQQQQQPTGKNGGTTVKLPTPF